MNPFEVALRTNRRIFLQRSGLNLGTAALGMLAGGTTARSIFGGEQAVANAAGIPFMLPGQRPKAKRVVYLFQAGAPSQLDLLDYKPKLKERQKQELPNEVRMGQRLTGMTAGQKSFPIASSIFKFAQHGQHGNWISELLPHIAGAADNLRIIRSMHTEAINHDPAITFIQTGSQLAGHPSMGAWVAYGLGTLNQDLPTFIVMVSRGLSDQPLYDRLWGSGCLASRYQGVKLRSGNEPVLYLTNPAGCDRTTRRAMLDDIKSLNMDQYAATGDPEVLTRIEQYELAFRMQATVPDLTDISKEPQYILDMYGPDVKRPGSYARNCLLARRLIERDVRFVQLYHMGWDQHGDLPVNIAKQCRDTDQPSAALVKDLKQRGLLDDTLVVWGGEFGRTVYSQGTLTATNYGRDHHPRCFSIWLAGGGIKAGPAYGTTDDYSYNVVENPVHVRDLNATILHCLGIDNRLLSVKHQGLDVRLTGVEEAHVLEPIL
jgi:hypothetical protein